MRPEYTAAASVLFVLMLAACSPQRQAQEEPGVEGREEPMIEEVRPVETGAADAANPAESPSRAAGERAEPRAAPPAPPAPGEESLTGRVAITGSEPFPMTTLIVEGGPPYRLTGELEGELRALSGATVRVEGRPAGAASALGQPFEVRRYEIVAIDGQRPQVGRLVARQGVWWLEGAERVRLAAVPEALQAQEGAKVWIVGRRAEGALQIQSYGIIRGR